MNKYEKYDIAFGVVVDAITDSKLSKVSEVNKAIQTLNELVHKEYPMSVKHGCITKNYRGEYEHEFPSCSECGRYLEFNEEACYCQYCGQRIDWSDYD